MTGDKIQNVKSTKNWKKEDALARGFKFQEDAFTCNEHYMYILRSQISLQEPWPSYHFLAIC